MKRIVFAFCMMFVATTSVVRGALPEGYGAMIYFPSEVVSAAVSIYFPAERRVQVLKEYDNNIKKDDGTITVRGLYQVCYAGGLDVNTTRGYEKCREFMMYMIKAASHVIDARQNKPILWVDEVKEKECIGRLNGVMDPERGCVGRDGYTLLYERSCEYDDHGTCVGEFADLQTTLAMAQEFILAYGNLIGKQFTCMNMYESSGWDYLVPCSAGGESYEFVFDDLEESSVDMIAKSESEAICKMFDGKIITNLGKNAVFNYDNYTHCDVSSAVCRNELAVFAARVGHDTDYQGGYCQIKNEPRQKNVIFLQTIDGVDNKIFYNAGVQQRMHVARPMVEQYLKELFPNLIHSIRCDSSITVVETNDFGFDTDYAMTCYVDGKRIDFLFDDLTESWDSSVQVGTDIMHCINNGGMFRGETCRGLTPDECTNLDRKLRENGASDGAHWDTDARACILESAHSQYVRDVVTGYVVGAVVIVGGTLVTIYTGGATAPVLLGATEMLVTDIAINATMDWNHRRLTNKAGQKYYDFMEDARKCTTEECALKVIEKHYATLNNVMEDLNYEDQATIDAVMDGLINLVKTELVACGRMSDGTILWASAADCAKHKSKLTVMDYVDPYSEIALVIGSVVYNPGYVTRRFMKMNKISKIRFGNTAGRVVENVPGANVSQYVTDLQAAYKKYAPVNMPFEDFERMWDSPEQFYDQVRAWDSMHFAPGEKPFSAFDSELQGFIRRAQTDTSGRYFASKISEHLRNMYGTEIYPLFDNIMMYISNHKPDSFYVWKQGDTVYTLVGKSEIVPDFATDIVPQVKALLRQDPELKRLVDEGVDLHKQGKFFDLLDEPGKKNTKDVIRDVNGNYGLHLEKVQKLVDKFVADRTALYVRIIQKPNILKRAKKWGRLSLDDKKQLLQDIIEHADDELAIPHSAVGYQDVVSQKHPRAMGVCYPDGSIYFKKGFLKRASFSDVMDTLAHEQAHKVDFLNPDSGILGGQMQDFVKSIYSFDSDVYRLNLTEQSSFKVGGAVGAQMYDIGFGVHTTNLTCSQVARLAVVSVVGEVEIMSGIYYLIESSNSDYDDKEDDDTDGDIGK